MVQFPITSGLKILCVLLFQAQDLGRYQEVLHKDCVPDELGYNVQKGLALLLSG